MTEQSGEKLTDNESNHMDAEMIILAAESLAGMSVLCSAIFLRKG